MTANVSEHLESAPGLIEPYGGALVNLLSPEDGGELLARAAGLSRIQLTARGVCDLELLARGGFSPLRRFMNRATRNECRAMVGHERFVEVFVDTPLEVCERRDTKGMYALARAGKLKSFTGVDDAYEPPTGPELRIETENRTAEENADLIIDHLARRGFLQRPRSKPGKN